MKTVLEPIATSGEAESSGTNNLSPAERTCGPIFVIGMWRSGTSLFYALLNQHPEVALMYEGDLFLLRPIFWLPGAGSRFARRWQFWNQALSRHKIEADALASASSSFRENLASAYREVGRHKGARLCGEKSPNYYDSILRLAREFPDARFIIIWRDPAAICRSILEAGKGRASWFTRPGMIVRTILGFRVMKRQCDLALAHGARLHQVQYEDFVTDPAGTMREVCGFLDIPFVPEMASLASADRSAIYEGEHHSLVQGEKIVRSRSTENGKTLPPRIRRKVDRYLTLWRKQTNEAWPPFEPTSPCAPPSVLERFVDACAYRCFRAFDRGVAILYSYAPFSLLRVWRKLANRSYAEVSQ